MFSKPNRLSRNDTNMVFKEGKALHSPTFGFKYLYTGEKQSSCTVIAPKKVLKSAVSRNRAKRRVYYQLRRLLNDTNKSFLGAFTIKKPLEAFSATELEQELRNLLKKTNIL